MPSSYPKLNHIMKYFSRSIFLISITQLFLQLIIFSDCPEISGVYTGTGSGSFIFEVEGEDTISIPSEVVAVVDFTINQIGCDISFESKDLLDLLQEIPDFEFARFRTGIVSDNIINISEVLLLIESYPGLNISNNTYTATGFINGNQIIISGSGELSGSEDGISFRLTVQNELNITKAGTTTDPNTTDPSEFILSVNTSSGGEYALSPSGVTVGGNQWKYIRVTDVLLDARPFNGYRFSHWSGDINSSQNPITIRVDGNKNVTANFERISNDDHGNNISSATSISLNTSIGGNLENNNDLDYFKIDVQSTGKLIVSTSSNTDTLGRLVASNGSVITEDDDSAGNFDFRIERDLSPGEYYIHVQSYQNNSSGSYTLNVSFQPTVIFETNIVSGSGEVSGVDIRHPNGNIYDQVLMTGREVTVRANPGQIVRTSFLDIDNDIVQVELSGSGTLRIELDNFQGSTDPFLYNQPGVRYMKGEPLIYVEGSSFDTNISIFSIGRISILPFVNNTLFVSDIFYDGMADVKFLQVTGNGISRIGCGNVEFRGSSGLIGIQVIVPVINDVIIGDVEAIGFSSPILMFGDNSQFGALKVAGGNLLQEGNKRIMVNGFIRIQSIDNVKSNGLSMPARIINASFVNRFNSTVNMQVEYP